MVGVLSFPLQVEVQLEIAHLEVENIVVVVRQVTEHTC